MPERRDLRVRPAIGFAPVGKGHMVGVVVTKFERVVRTRFRVQLASARGRHHQVLMLQQARQISALLSFNRRRKSVVNAALSLFISRLVLRMLAGQRSRHMLAVVCHRCGPYQFVANASASPQHSVFNEHSTASVISRFEKRDFTANIERRPSDVDHRTATPPKLQGKDSHRRICADHRTTSGLSVHLVRGPDYWWPKAEDQLWQHGCSLSKVYSLSENTK